MIDDEEMDSSDLGTGTQSDAAPQPLKGVGAKKGPKLARSRKKQSVTITNKVVTKGSKPTPKKGS